MFSWLRRHRPTPDPEQFLYDLRRGWTGVFDDDPKSRQEAFRRTFANPEGRQVLYQIFLWGGLYTPDPEINEALQRAAGRRDVCLRILAALNADIR